MANIEEFRASLTAKRDTAARLADEAGATNVKAYHRGRVHAYEQARKMLADVDLPDGWEPPPNLEREDHHCATCQCAGTECHEVVWCKRVWGHSGNHSIIRDEDFR